MLAKVGIFSLLQGEKMKKNACQKNCWYESSDSFMAGMLLLS